MKKKALSEIRFDATQFRLSSPRKKVEDKKIANDNFNNSEENLCGVCFANEPDSVYMPCGHGGICYDCAIDIWKSSDECYLCRKV